MDKQTILNQTHRNQGARMVSFGGWDMPVHYGSQLDEHHAVRNDAGMFDVCHMSIVDIRGPGSTVFLRQLLANDVSKLQTAGKALYSCMLKQDGGVIDDLITYYLDDDWYRLVVNAATTDKDLAWIKQQASGHEVTVSQRADLGMIAVQGPEAKNKLIPLLEQNLAEQVAGLKPFHAAWLGEWFIGRTGYTGEDGFEVMLPTSEAEAFWLRLTEAGVRPCGLGARDTLRLEAGMNLYGSDMDESVSPLESGLSWTVDLKDPSREFIGRDALAKQKAAGALRQFGGLLLEAKGVLRDHLPLFSGERQIGEITSGGFSPTLQRSIALARLDATVMEDITVDVRGRKLPVKLVRPPFVRNGQACIEL